MRVVIEVVEILWAWVVTSESIDLGLRGGGWFRGGRLVVLNDLRRAMRHEPIDMINQYIRISFCTASPSLTMLCYKNSFDKLLDLIITK